MSTIPISLGTQSSDCGDSFITTSVSLLDEPTVVANNHETTHNNVLITPPSSTIRKNKTLTEQKSRKGLLSPTKSSPTPPAKARRNRSDGCSRVNGSLSLNDIIKSLIKRKQTGQFTEKPPYSYAIIICLAILQSHEGKLTLSQIYHWISTHFPFFQLKDSSWQNSIRHNLSLNEGFIKTIKSSDGKGHFWQVKESSAQKFFKHETRSYDEIRNQLKDLDYYFFHDSTESIDPHDSVTISQEDNNNLVSPPTISISQLHHNDAASGNKSKRKSHDSNNEDKEETMRRDSTPLIQISSPPPYTEIVEEDIISESSPNRKQPNYFQITNLMTLPAMKRSQTTLGLQNYENRQFLLRTPTMQSSATFGNDFPPTQDMFPNQSMFNNPNSQSNSLLSPKNYKKYICSFNSKFEMSPSKLDIASSIMIDNDEENDFQRDTGSFNVKSNLEQFSVNNPMELLKTPDLRRTQSLEDTPIQLLSTPRDSRLNDNIEFTKDNLNNGSNNSSNNNNNNTDMLMKNWKTPSHLFEDIYSSPIMKAMGRTPITKISSTPNGTIIKTFSPRKLSAPDLLGSSVSTTTTTTTIKTKLSSGGLFGVDVYSVWERALKDIDCSKWKSPNNKVSSTSTNAKLDLPFVSKPQNP